MARVLARARLFRALDRARASSVIWIQAPPGAGKTALLASWLRARRLHALWYTLDEGDDAASLFDALGDAAAGGASRRGLELPRFQPAHMPTIGAFARRFFGALASRPGAPEVVVLDDYHAVRAGSLVHRALAEGLAGSAHGTTVVVASRTGPPRDLARLRAAGQLVTLPASSLALTRVEARTIARLHSRRPPPDRILALADGWAAGVVLLAVAGSQSAEASAVARCSVFEYLASEVFEAADPSAREVVLRTCLLPTVGAEAAARLSGVARAADVLSDLAGSGWFVETVRAEPLAYRLHALFREFLASRARETLGPDGFGALVRASAAHLLGVGDVDAAASLLAAERAWDDLVRVLVERGPALAAAGRLEAMARWLEVVPESYVDAEPWLRFWRGVSRFLADPPGAIASVEAAFEAFSRAGDALGAWRSWAAAADLRIHALDDVAPIRRLMDAVPSLRARFPIPDPATEAAVVGTVLAGTVYGDMRARGPSLRGWEDRALGIALSPGDARVRMDVARWLVLYCAYWGTDLVRARVVLESLGPLATAPGVDPIHTLAWHVAEASYHVHVGDARAALDAANRGLAIADRSAIPVLDSVLLTVRIHAALADEDYAGAARDLRALARADARGRLGACQYHQTAATLALRRGDLHEAIERARIAARLADEAGHPLARSAAHVVWAAAADRGGFDGPMLAEAGRLARTSGYEIAEMGVGMLAAGAALAKGAEQDAEASLRGAFEISRRTGALNSAYVPRADLAELCAFALERGIEPDLAEQIVRARRLPPGRRARGVPTWPWAVRVSALGALSIRCEGRAPLEGKAQRKPLELLGLLVAHGERGASLERLAEALWPNADGDTAHHALETTMYRLRRMLGDPAAVVRHAGRASLDPARVYVDAWALEGLAARAEALRVRGDLAEALRAAAAAADMYRGDLLADSDEPAVAEKRALLRERLERLSALRAPIT